MRTDVIAWEDPPERRGSARGFARADWKSIASVLKSNAGKWAIIYENGGHGYRSVLVARLRYGFEDGRTGRKYPPSMPVEEFEFTCRGSCVYARYVGGSK